MNPFRVANWWRFLGLRALIVLLLMRAIAEVAHYLSEGELSYGLYVMFSALGMLVHAAYRANRQNPATNWRYHYWLCESPWQWGRALPLGWARLGLADLLLVMLYAAVFPAPWQAGLLIGAVSFAIGYVWAAWGCAAAHNEPLLSVGGLVLLGLGIAFSAGPEGPTLWPLVITLMLALALSQVSLPRVLKRLNELRVDPFSDSEREALKLNFHWAGSPWDQLLAFPDPDAKASGESWVGPVALVLWFFGCFEYARRNLVVWASNLDVDALYDSESVWSEAHQVFHMLAVGVPDSDFRTEELAEPIGVLIALVLLLLTVLIGTGRLRAGHPPPISLLGRIATGRLIIPGYDRLYLGGLVSIAVFTLVAAPLVANGWLGLLAGGVALAAALSALVLLTPDLETWRLTGHHRIVCSRPLINKKK